MANYVVDTNSDITAADGILTLREAIALANANPGEDTITFASGGVFDTDAVIRLVEGQITITDATIIDGSTAGGTVTITGDADSDDVVVNGITDVAASGVGLLDDNSRLFSLDGVDADTTFDSLILTGGRTTAPISPFVQSSGGAINASGADLTLTNSTVSGNSTAGDGAVGGGVKGSTVTLTNSTVSGNSTAGADAFGGGIAAFDVTLTNSTVSGNSTAGFSADGGGICAPTATLTNSTVSNNSTANDGAYGGGIWAITATLTNSTVSNNSTANDGAYGGGIWAITATLTNSTVSGNSTLGISADGGGIYAGNVTLEYSTVSGNSTAGNFSSGGGIAADTATLTNSTVSGNSTAEDSADGGGISAVTATLTNSTVSGNSTAANYAQGGGISAVTATLTNSTVSGNSTAGNFADGGGIRAATSAMLANSLVTGNVAQQSSGNDIRGPVTLQGANIIGSDFHTDTDGTPDGATSAQAIFASTQYVADDMGGTAIYGGVLADNGGPVQTIALLRTPANPAVDSSVASTVFKDARGLLRPFDGDNNGVAISDLGAFEIQELPSLVVTTTADVVQDDGETSLREAIAFANSNTDQSTITFASGSGEAFENDALIRLTQGELVITQATIIDGSSAGGELVITGDANDDDITVGTSDITDVAASYGGTPDVASDRLDDNSRLFLLSGVDADTTFDSLILTGGRTTNSLLSDRGGAISGSSADVTLTNSTVSGNSTARDGAHGGGIFASTAELTNSTVSGNSTAGNFAYGGGIYAGTASLTNSTVSDNSTASDGSGGGGIAAGTATLTNSTVSGNSTAANLAYGGGIFAGLTATLTNSVVTGNVALASPDNDIRGPVTLQGANIIGSYVHTDTDGTPDGATSTQAIFASTQYVADDGGTAIYGGVLADNGGPVQTIALLANAANPAIDAATTPLTDDARGFARPVDLGAASVNAADLGAFEAQYLPVKIHEVQGSGATSSMVGSAVEIEGIVVGDYDDVGELFGFFLQEEDADVDGNSLTSEGIFVYVGGASVATVSEGDLVRVVGTVDEFFGQTQIDTISELEVISSGNLATVTALDISLPAASGTYDEEATHEALEGMLVTFTNTLVVSEFFQLARYGQIVLTEGGVPTQFTQVSAPDVAGYAAHQDLVGQSQIILDDANNTENFPTSIGGDFAYAYPEPGLSLTNFFRGGDSINGLTGVLSWSASAWRVRPVETEDYSFTAENVRPTSPDNVGGTLKVASVNVQNYFATLDTTPGFSGPRGADSAAELTRQTDKIVAALVEMDADIVGLIELENDFNFDGGTALELLVDALNAATAPGTYAYVDPGRDMVDVADVISNALIYKTATAMLTPGTSVSILDDTQLDSVDAIVPGAAPGTAVFDGDTTNRASIAATFTEIATGATLTVANNHFKSKGSPSPGANNLDQLDGAGRNNEIRDQAANAVAAWLETNPTGSSTDNVLIIGDLNAYAKEDPIVRLENAGFTNLVAQFNGDTEYSFRFDGETGTLDYALASAALTGAVTGATAWHINADEVAEFDYDDDVLDPGELSFERKSDALPIYAADAFRSSDHDPIIVGLNLNDAPILSLVNVVDTLPEGTDTSARIKVADIVVSDDSPAGNVLTLSGADADLFEIVGSALYLRAGVVLDFEGDAQFDVVVEVDDPSLGSGPEDSVPFTLNVLDVNEAPVVNVRFTPSELPEDTDTSSPLRVGSIVIYDDALGRADLSLSGGDAGMFEIDGLRLMLREGVVLDFETNPVLDVTVTAVDPDLPGIETFAPVSINVTDVDETTPPTEKPEDTGVTKSGGPNDDLLIGTPFSDELFGLGGNDTLIGLQSDDLLDGGDGDGDVAVFSGPASHYTIEITPDGVIVTDRRADGDGSDMLIDIETIRFTEEPDGSLGEDGTEFDLDSYSAIASLTEAQLEVITQFYIGLYDRAPDAFGLFFWATQLANGLSEAEITEYFINSPEAIAIFGATPTNSEIVSSAFDNFFDREVDTEGQAFWTGLLDNGVISIPEFFTLIDEGAEAPTGSAMDVLTLQDQVDIGLYFSAINGLSDVPDATEVLAIYDKDDRDPSLVEAVERVDTFAMQASSEDDGQFLIQLTGVIDSPFETMV